MAKYQVDVKGATYEVDAPDENTAWAWANQTHEAQAQPQPKQETPSGFVKGLKDPIDAGAQLLTHILPRAAVDAGDQLNNWLADKTGLVAKLPERNLSSVISGNANETGVDRMIKQQEQKYQAEREAAGKTGIDWGRMAGNVFNPANIAVASKIPQAVSLAGRMALGATSGAMFGVAQPVTNGDYWTEKGKQAGAGAVTGGVLPAVTGGLARVVSPKGSPQLSTLSKEGVETTIGQKLGGAFRKAEEGIKSIPFVGDVVAAAERRGVEGLNKAALNRSLAPVNETLPNNVGVGNKAVAYVSDKLSQYYDDVLSKVSGTIDDNFSADLNNLRSMAESMPTAQKEQFNRILDNEVIGRFTQAGKASGETIKNIESKLGSMSRGYGRSGDYDQRILGDAIRETQNSLRQMLIRNNPKYAPQLAKVNEAYANFMRVENAAGRLGSKEGVFTPGQLRGAVRALDPSRNKRQFAQGNAMMQDLADAADNVLANKLPDSGTAYRSIWNPATLLGTIVGLPASIPSAAIYNPVSSKLIDMAMASRPQLAAPAAQAIRQSAPFLAPGVVPFGYGLLNPSQQ